MVFTSVSNERRELLGPDNTPQGNGDRVQGKGNRERERLLLATIERNERLLQQRRQELAEQNSMAGQQAARLNDLAERLVALTESGARLGAQTRENVHRANRNQRRLATLTTAMLVAFTAGIIIWKAISRG